MRLDGVRLAERLLVARVTASAEIPLTKWPSGFFKVMPLPGLMGNHYSAHFKAASAFHQWIRGRDESGVRRQKLLAKPQQRAGIRRQMRRHLKSEYS